MTLYVIIFINIKKINLLYIYICCTFLYGVLKPIKNEFWNYMNLALKIVAKARKQPSATCGAPV